MRGKRQAKPSVQLRRRSNDARTNDILGVQTLSKKQKRLCQKGWDDELEEEREMEK